MNAHEPLDDDVWNGKLKILMRNEYTAQAFIPAFGITVDIQCREMGDEKGQETISFAIWKNGRAILTVTRFNPLTSFEEVRLKPTGNESVEGKKA